MCPETTVVLVVAYYSLNCVFYSDTYVAWTSCRLQSISQQQDGNYEEEVKNKILAAAMPFVAEFGWSKEAIGAGAEAVGYPGVVHGLFPGGGADLVHFFQKTSNMQLVEKLKKVARSCRFFLRLS